MDFSSILDLFGGGGGGAEAKSSATATTTISAGDHANGMGGSGSGSAPAWLPWVALVGVVMAGALLLVVALRKK